MKKRVVPFLALMLLVLGSGNAMAYCERCRAIDLTCLQNTLRGGVCIFDQWGDCVETQPGCEPAAVAVAPLASEFAVASVERLDEAQPAADATRVAQLDVKAPSTH
ncbi:MAG TPA: hypothetical protein VGF69_09380 [Thermoanaerobaculia bacterium]|jgi:hypothetical protein